MNASDAPMQVGPEEFERICGRVVEIAVEYLKGMDARMIPPQVSGKELAEIYRAELPEKGIGEEAIAGLAQVAEHSRAQNGRFFGYILGSGENAAAAADLLCSVINQNVTAWRSAPAAIAIEQTVVGWLAQAIGCANFRGVLTGGGSSANLMALAMAREAKAPANDRGVQGPVAMYASPEAHMSNSKAIALLGIGRENLRQVAVDEALRMRADELESAMRADTALGVTPVAVIASAGTVATGAIDPFAEIARIAAKYGAWLHVDGAYGALGAIAAPEKFAGMDLADSISLDPHKWLYQPIDCGCLLYRDADAARRAFANTGDYVRVLSNDPMESYAVFEESIELSRRFRALKLWFSLRYHGFGAVREAIRKDLRHAQRLAEAVRRSPEVELMAPVELSAVCFRYAGDGTRDATELDDLNLKILRGVIQRGAVYLSNATVQGHFCLRACIVNHRTTDADVDRVVEEVLAVATEAAKA